MSLPKDIERTLNSDAQARLDRYIAKYREEPADWLLTAIAAHYRAYHEYFFEIKELPLDIHAAAILEGLLDE